jgi:DNA-directed RNA polymerase specialized sigma24 family protein
MKYLTRKYNTTEDRDAQRKRVLDHSMLETLTEEEYANAPCITPEEVEEALRKGAEDLRRVIQRKPRGRW